MVVTLTFIAAVLPPLFLTAFFLTHFRHRLGIGLGLKSVLGGMVSAPLALGFSIMLSRFGLPEEGLVGAASRAWLGAAIPEEVAKFLIVWFYIRRHPQCDSGGDLFCGAALVGLGFSLLENILYLSDAKDWLMTGLLRGAMAVPGHTIDGMMMGVFLAWWWRKEIAPAAAILLALVLPILAHGFYDFPLMALSSMKNEIFYGVDQLREKLILLHGTIMVISAIAAIWAGRMELIEVYARKVSDIDLYPPSSGSVILWRWVGGFLIVGATALAAYGISVARSESVPEGIWFLVLATFPAAFGIVMIQPLPDGVRDYRGRRLAAPPR